MKTTSSGDGRAAEDGLRQTARPAALPRRRVESDEFARPRRSRSTRVELLVRRSRCPGSRGRRRGRRARRRAYAIGVSTPPSRPGQTAHPPPWQRAHVVAVDARRTVSHSRCVRAAGPRRSRARPCRRRTTASLPADAREDRRQLEVVVADVVRGHLVVPEQAARPRRRGRAASPCRAPGPGTRRRSGALGEPPQGVGFAVPAVDAARRRSRRGYHEPAAAGLERERATAPRSCRTSSAPRPSPRRARRAPRARSACSPTVLRYTRPVRHGSGAMSTNCSVGAHRGPCARAACPVGRREREARRSPSRRRRGRRRAARPFGPAFARAEAVRPAERAGRTVEREDVALHVLDVDESPSATGVEVKTPEGLGSAVRRKRQTGRRRPTVRSVIDDPAAARVPSRSPFGRGQAPREA